MNSLSVWARQYVRLVMIGGAAVSIYAVTSHRVADIWNLLLMIILTCQMATVKIPLRFGSDGCSMLMSFPFTFAALLNFGVHEGIIVAVFCALSQCLLNYERKPPRYRLLFNVAQLALTVSISGSVYTLCGGRLPMPVTNISAAALVAGVLAYWWSTTGLVSGAISLSAQKPFGAVWITTLKWSAVNFIFGGFLAVWLVSFFHGVGIGIFVLLYPLLYLMHFVYRLVSMRPAILGRN
ncbi:MAG: hypothetical protein HY232_12445 [Acidobacteria bacterium]|nr:hypothetical protein [Acidobacteriota bacterium]